jgi:hypothetical protein
MCGWQVPSGLPREVTCSFLKLCFLLSAWGFSFFSPWALLEANIGALCKSEFWKQSCHSFNTTSVEGPCNKAEECCYGPHIRQGYLLGLLASGSLPTLVWAVLSSCSSVPCPLYSYRINYEEMESQKKSSELPKAMHQVTNMAGAVLMG